MNDRVQAATAAVNNDGRIQQPPRNATYRSESFKFLKKEFPLLSVESIKTTWEFHHYEFTATFRDLQEIDNAPENAADNERFAFLNGVQKIRIKHRRTQPPFRVRDPDLLSELGGMDEMNQKSGRRQAGPAGAGQDAEDADDDVEIISIIDGVETVSIKDDGSGELMLECACCFGDFPFHEMVQCTEAHLFCTDCLQHHVHEQIHERNSTFFACMDSSDQKRCQGFFDRKQIDKLSVELQELIDKKVALQEVKKAGIGSECPQCPSIGFVEDPRVVFVQCLQCSHVYCRLCFEPCDIHRDKSCQQVQEEKKENKIAERN